MAKALVELLRQRFPEAVIDFHSQHGDDTAVIDVTAWHDVAAWLRDDPAAAMNLLVDLTAVDYPDRVPRFEVVAHFLSLSLGHRLRLKARVGDEEGEGAEIGTLTDLWASANWLERECFDMFGVVFQAHPDLRRILLYPEFIGHPLRRDYPAERAQPLVPYRELPNIDRLPPFGREEGMSFSRTSLTAAHPADAEDEN